MGGQAGQSGARRRVLVPCVAAVVALASPAVTVAGPGDYGAPEWLPVRHGVNGTEVKVGCGFASPDGLCAGHHGYWAVDLIAVSGTPVYASGAGFARAVTGAGFEGYGRAVLVDHGGAGKSLYAHLDAVHVGAGGTWVTENDVIGTVGASGAASTAHLHYEESATDTFGSRGSRDPGAFNACHGPAVVTYPDALGHSSWRGIAWGAGAVVSDGTGCGPTGGVGDSGGADVVGVVAAAGTASGPSAPDPEEVVGADFDGDGADDVASRNIRSGLFTIRYGPELTRTTNLEWAPGEAYSAFAADFGGDGIADIGLRESDTGTLYIRPGPDFSTQVTHDWEPGDHFRVVAGDFNADRMGDVGLRDALTGQLTVRFGPAFDAEAFYELPPESTAELFGADFTGDRMDDVWVFDTDSRELTIAFSPTYFGRHEQALDPDLLGVAFAADANGDGAADLGLKKPGNDAIDFLLAPTFESQIRVSPGPGLTGVEGLLGQFFAQLASLDP